MPEVVFLDTSVLCALLDIPGKNSSHDAASVLFRKLVDSGATLILPIASVVETGNHIAQLESGAVRRDRAERLNVLLRSSADSISPWVVNNTEWDADHVRNLVDGLEDPFVPDWIQAATEGVGMGDLSICHEMLLYSNATSVPSAQPIQLWTFDADLARVAASLGFPLAG